VCLINSNDLRKNLWARPPADEPVFYIYFIRLVDKVVLHVSEMGQPIFPRIKGHKMTNMKFMLFIVLVIPLASCSQTINNSFFDESNYKEIKRGRDEVYPYVIVYVNKSDSNYILKKNYLFDSTYQGNTYGKTFYYRGVANGPFESIIGGKISQKGVFKNGNYDGERLYFTEGGRLSQRAFFKNGVKFGTWEEYNEKGKLIKKIKFDENGKILKEEKFE
jgi:antitoxin component YwqK of YwqJK toxin-antitoxin module